MRFEQGKSYLWLFPIYAGLFAAGCAISVAASNDLRWGILVMPAFIGFMLISEVRSGVALDSWWRASHPQGTFTYQAMIAWHAVVLAAFVAFSVFFIR